ncbi:FMN adenylyltransferase /riboflavin kinase [Anaerobacterium chartisolvens]|uniref:Riboflavin biosynthesis protein n=1 Tax=Anaerobacterium chartisolvens TaxID=1297424 RepID=A0A369ASS9_9FIRM|nr:bifunctional riboflavin kinase/FAD synthetase [Anaerobacterium chartisolvens]RCX11408.1 FMN adenylyltransferase /riboflavin kinase [Anaerobacterium chartisolvens]
MKVIYGNIDSSAMERQSGVGLGNFDGLHIGHMALVNTLIRESKLNGLDSIVYTFTRHTGNILRKKLVTPLLTTEAKKVELLGETSLDYLYFDKFDEEFSRIAPEAFVKDVLVARLKMRLAVAGFHYRFGYNGAGDVELLKSLGRVYGFKVIIIPPIKIDDQVISSTQIRDKVAKSSMEDIFKLLGRHYSITAVVVSGRRVGNTIGFPTANINPEDYLVLPMRGVYITRTLLDGRLYNSITNIGFNPTFEDNKRLSVETHIIDFEEDIYGKKIEVFFLSKIRDEKKFESIEQLKGQIKIDMRRAREFFDINVQE